MTSPEFPPRANRWLRAIWLLAGLALALSLLRDSLVRESSMASVYGRDAAWYRGGFVPGGTFPSTSTLSVPAPFRQIGSWQNGDEWTGEVETPWTATTAPAYRLWVAGYPRHAGCDLHAEFRFRDGRIERVDCSLNDPGEVWRPWDFPAPADAVAFRVVARDQATDRAGWLAFSEPVVRTSSGFASAFMGAQVFATVALALTLVWGPGLLWRPRNLPVELRTVFLLGAGPALLVVMALAIWCLDGAVRPHVLGFIFVTTAWAALGAGLWRRPLALERGAGTILAVASLVVVAAAAKATYAGGPDGELYGGTISRTLAVGDRSDARISFHVVQVLAHHLAPADPVAEQYFLPWTFFRRGPLAGLAAAPVALATAGVPPREMPDQAWEPFDRTGFAAYRIVLMTLASMIVVALFAAVRLFVDERWAVIAGGLLALSPFGVHEILFTWPKWEATTWVVVSFILAHQRRPIAAGLALGVGFLFHPLAALWTPWIALWAAGRAGLKPGPFLAQGARFGVSASAIVIGWMLVGKVAPHSKWADAGQGGFLDYFHMADGAFTWDVATWCRARVTSFANTFLPFWLHVFHRDHPALSSIYGPSSATVRFAFGWWNTLPLGLGLGVWLASVAAGRRAGGKYLWALLLLVVSPALGITLYWGAAVTGLMRECAHPLVPAIIGLTVVVAAHTPGRLARCLAHPLVPWLQLPETLLMLWLTTLVAAPPGTSTQRGLDVACLVINLVAACGAAFALARFRGGWTDATPHAASQTFGGSPRFKPSK